MQRGDKWTEEGPDGLQLVFDTTDDATPVMVVMKVGRKSHTATFDCATGVGELGCGDYALTQEQLRWLSNFEEEAAEAYDVARAGNPEYR